MGLANDEEQEQVTAMILADKELYEYISRLEEDIKRYFSDGSVHPPEAVREIIMLRSIREKKGPDTRDKSEPIQTNEYLNVEVNDTHIKVHKFWRPAFIAVFILSKIFLIAGLYFYFKSLSQQEELQRIKTEIQQNK